MQQDSSIKVLHDLARRNKIYIEYQLENEFNSILKKLYTIRLNFGDKTYVVTESNMKLAQYKAAQSALDDYRNSKFINHYDQDFSQMNANQSPLILIKTWAIRNHLSTHYVLLNEQFLPPTSNRSRNVLYYRLYIGHDLYFDGQGSTHQQARIACALNALYFLRRNEMSPPSTPQLNYSSSSSSQTKLKYKTKSEISLMYERAKQLGLPVRIEIDDPFTVTYHVGEKYSSTGKGFNKNSAKQLAAEKMLEILSSCHIEKSPNPITRIYQLAQIRQVNVKFIPLDNKENFTYQIQFGENDMAEGFGKTKQMAKRSAAEALINKLDPIIVLPPPPAKGLLKRDGNNHNLNKQEKKHVHFQQEIIEKDEQISSRQTTTTITTHSISNKQQLIEACQRLEIHIKYQDEINKNENCGSSRYQTIVSLSTNARLLAQFRGQGPSLKRAQENASSAAWNNLKELFNGSIE